MSNSYVCIEGNIGAGKTTFTKRYAEITGASTILEQFSDNPFLASFYKNPRQFAFPLEMSFLAERFQQLNNIFSKPDLFAKGYVSDYTFLKTLIFAKNNLQEDEYELFKSFYRLLAPKLTKPDAVIFLQTTNDYLNTNIKQRGRNYEQQIETKYLETISNLYSEFLLRNNEYPIILVPYTNDSWKNLDQNIQNIFNLLISNKLTPGIHLI